MRAVVLEDKGGPEVLGIMDIPDPAFGPEEILVDVRATALNRADLLQRMGLYPQPGKPPVHEVPGMEFAGVVAAIGDHVTRWDVGDEVMGIVSGGAYAERLALHELQAMAIPSTVTLDDAAAIPEVWITAFDALVLQGGLTSGGWALVHAGASGVGTAAIQICRAIGARVIVTTSSGKLARCEELGAERAVDYAKEDFADVARELTGGRGVDVVLDVIGGEYVERNIDSVRVTGAIIQVGVMGNGMASFPLGKLLPKRATLRGTVLRSRPLDEKIAVTRAFADQLLPRFEDGTLEPVIDRRFALDDIAAAHDYLASNQSVGKVLIDVSV